MASLLAGVVGIGLSVAWIGFQHLVERVTGDAFTARQRSFTAQLLVDAEQAARRTYLRWLAAGLDGAIALLAAIADGSHDPREPAVVRACGQEETHLRQLIQIGPELVHLGAALMSVLRHAHSAQVPFTLRVGGVDTTDVATARAIADLLRTIIDQTPVDAQATLSASILPVRQQLRLTVTGPALPAHVAGTGLGEARTMRLGTIDLLELTCAGVAVHDIEEN